MAGFHGLVFERLDSASVASTPLRVVDPDGPGGEPERSAIGLYYARNRWYSPQLGRFLSRDPKDAAGPAIVAMHMNGSALSAALMPFSAAGHYGDGPNVYGFARSNPVTIRDPMRQVALSAPERVTGACATAVSAVRTGATSRPANCLRHQSSGASDFIRSGPTNTRFQ